MNLSEEEVQCFMDCAILAAKTAGDYAVANLDKRQEYYKLFDNDVKLMLDIKCQEIATEVIEKQFPKHSILGEEDESVNENKNIVSDFEWVIDPIDGTVNFSHGMNRWCCSVALRHKGKSIVGVVYAAEQNKLYTATIHSQSMCNGEVISVSKISSISKAIVFTGADTNSDFENLSFFTRIARNVQRPRISGSAALDVCDLASGLVDGYFEATIYIWDVAAAGLILERAGGTGRIIERGKKANQIRYLASNGLIQDQLRNLFPEFSGYDDEI
jgi:myo-inositol-1(or 4)-monophosphatase